MTDPSPVGGARQAINALTEAIATARPCRPIRDFLPAGDIGAAYVVQRTMAADRVASGATPVGRKIGLTNPKVQEQLGVDQPDFGILFDDMSCGQHDPIRYGRLLQPRIEAEVAFVLGSDLAGHGEFLPAQIAGAVQYAVAALEIVDSRIQDWDINILDTVADNGSSGLFVLGDVHATLNDLDPVEVVMTMSRGTETVSSGSGRECFGSPLRALTWLATTARDYGSPLRAGDIVLSGALGPMITVSPGDRFDAQLSGLGRVSATFTDR